jgi:EmrB/QacA subfamily drug resistance transporter
MGAKCEITITKKHPYEHLPMIRKERLAIAALALAAGLGTAGLGSVNIAIPQIATDLHATLSMVSWVISGYLLIIAGFCIIIGRIADVHGLKRTFLEGLLLFSAASLICYAAWDIYILIAARFLQAAGAAMFIATGLALVAACLPFSERGAGLSWISAASMAGSVAGVGIGGIICGIFGWRGLFLLMVLLGLAAFLVGKRYIPDIPAQPSISSFDIAGSVLLFCAMTTLLAGLSLDYQPAVSDLIPHSLYLVSLLLWAAFIRHALRTPGPVLDITLFKNRQFSVAMIATTIMNITLGGIMFLIPFILTEGLDLSVSTAGLILMAAAGFAIFISPVSGYLADRFGSRPVCIAGALLTLVTLAGLSLVNGSLLHVGILLVILFRISFSVYSSPSAKLILDHSPPGREGAASGIMQTSRNAAYTIGIAIYVLIFEGAVYSAGLPSDGTPILPRLTEELMRTGYHATFAAAILITLPALVFCFLARDRKGGRTQGAGLEEDDAAMAGF